MRGPRSLRTRLFLWFLGAIFVAFASSAVVVGCSRPEAFTTGAEIMARTVSARLATVWDDQAATDAFVVEVKNVTGFEVRLWRDPQKLPPIVRRVAQRGGAFAPGGPERVFVPVVRNGTLVGALQMERYGGGFTSRPLWRLGLALGAALVVLAFAAGRVSNELARPLEKLEQAADRFGAGDLAFRTDLADAPKRWVAHEVHGVALAFNKMAERVEATVRGQRELLGAISHELRSPLGRARIALEIARDRVGADDDTSSSRRPALPQLDVIENQLLEVDTILGDLLAVTRAGLADIRREPIALLAWLRARLDEEVRGGPIQLEATVGDDLEIRADAALLARAVHNVVANARVHGHPEAEPLVVHLSADADRVRITVRDRGPGFAADFLPRAFDPFVRGDVARVRVATGGSGLGLALVRRIAEAHGGGAFARNVVADAPAGTEPGEAACGAEVGIELPRQ